MNKHSALDVHDAYAQRSGVLPVAPAAVANQGRHWEQSCLKESLFPSSRKRFTVGKRQIQRGGVRASSARRSATEAQVTLHVSGDRAVDRPVSSMDAAFQEETLSDSGDKRGSTIIVQREAR